MLRFRFAIPFLLASSLAAAAAGAGDPVARAAAFVAALEAGEFEKASQPFDAAMKQGLPLPALKETWEQLLAQAGALKSKGPQRTLASGGYTTILQELRFERMPLDIRVAVNDATGEIAGLFFTPASGEGAPVGEAEPSTKAVTGPSPDAPYIERDIEVGAGGGALPGLLTLPKGEGPWPCVVLVHGSGPNDRDETLGPNKPFRDIAWGLAERGIASIRYDKRTKAHPAAMSAMLADLTLDGETVLDAVLAAKLARSTPGIDPDRVFVLGHSLGGMALPRIAARAPGLAGLVFLAALAEPAEDAILRQTEYIVGLDGNVDERERAALDQIRAQVALVKSDSLSADTPPATLPLGLPGRYWLHLRDVDVANEAAQVPLPMLVAQGGRDYQVTMKDFERLRDALRGRKDVRFAAFPDLNHLFMKGEGPPAPTDYMVPGHVAPELLDAVAGFVRAAS